MINIEMETGDIILFKSITCCACCVSFFTRSTTNHVGIVLKDIKLSNQTLSRSEKSRDEKFDELQLNGVYVLQSGMEFVKNVEKKYALGVQIHKLSDLSTSYPSAFYRHIKIKRNDDFINKINEFWCEIKDAPYDLTIKTWEKLTEAIFFDRLGADEINWKEKLDKVNFEIQMRKLLLSQTDKFSDKNNEGFTCSALLAYLLIKLGLLDSKHFTNGWKAITPRFFDELQIDWLNNAQHIDFSKTG